MSREQDRALAQRCRTMGEVATSALGWLANNEKLVGNRRAGLERTFKRRAVEARKLAIAAERPMSVGVFGASQAGKSFLIGSFISPADHPGKVVFGEGASAVKKDFLNEVNPTGGDETTGLVTRFSMAAAASPSANHPVVLRLLNETDLVKILTNTFALDLRGRSDTPLTPDRVRTLFDQQATHVDPSRPVPGMVAEDVFELEDYLEHEIDGHPLGPNAQSGGVAEEYWFALERAAPYLEAESRAQVLAPLWGEIPQLTELYLHLKDALDRLGHPEFAFAPLSAIEDRSHGVLHVQSVLKLGQDTADGSLPVELVTDRGGGARLPQSVVAALTAELRVKLDEKPWDFFEHTDLLDFPGARGRENKTAADYLHPEGEEYKPTNRAYCFLRGKIAVLFDKYSADLDLNTMLLCSDDRNQEVRKLAELVHRWVGRTHGRTPPERQGKQTTLFLCLTKADNMFNEMAGAETDKMIHARIKKDIDFYSAFTEEWMPGHPFDHTFMVRNPKFARRDLFDYVGDDDDAAGDDASVIREIGIKAAARPRLEQFEASFVAQPIVKRHIADAAEKLQAVLAIGDGGIAYLAQHLAPTCNPDLKRHQVEPRAARIRAELVQALEPFHEGSDLEQRVAERQRAVLAMIQAIMRNGGASLGSFLADLMIIESSLVAVFMDVARGRWRGGPSAPARPETTTALGRAGPGAMVVTFEGLDLPGIDAATAAPAEEAPPGDLAQRFAEAAVSHWLEQLERKADTTDLPAAYGLESEHFRTVLNELTIAARRTGLSGRIADAVRPTIQYLQRPDQQCHRVALIAALEINDLITYLARNRPEAEEGQTLFPTVVAPPAGGLPDLPADLGAMARERGLMLSAWLRALSILAKENARAASGSLVDVDQNRILGEMIARLRD